jgi:hypothetical protein
MRLFSRLSSLDQNVNRVGYWWTFIVLVVSAMGAVAGALYAAFGWVHGHGWPGWVLAAAGAFMVVAVMVILAAWAWTALRAAQGKDAPIVAIKGEPASEPSEAATRYEIDIAPILKALEVAVRLEDQFARLKHEVASRPPEWNTFKEKVDRSIFLLLSLEIDRLRIADLHRLVSECPPLPEDSELPFENRAIFFEKLEPLESYVSRVGGYLFKTQWWNDWNNIFYQCEHQAEQILSGPKSDLLGRGDTFSTRKFYIARLRCENTVAFLNRSAEEAESGLFQYLELLEPRKVLSGKP